MWNYFPEIKRNRIFNPIRLKPSFIIIGAQRSGTTSLYNYLTNHPGILYAGKKEIHYYDINYELGKSWYQNLFPAFKLKYFKRIIHGKKVISGEASPYYLLHPLVPERIYKDFPSIKLIVILRDPVDRAFSHYNLMKDKGIEKYSFEEAISKEAIRLAEEYDQFIINKSYKSYNYQNFSYLKRGCYAEQLEQWFKYFPRNQFYILKSEDLFLDPVLYMSKIFNFLGVESYNMYDYPIFNQKDSFCMNMKTRKYLEEYYKPHNEKLSALLKEDFKW